MRQFIVLGHDAPTDGAFALDDLPGGAGRLDVLCRSVGAALFLSHDIREAVRVWLVHQDEVVLRIEGSELRYMSPDERNIASLLQKALAETDDLIGHMEAESTPGIYVSRGSFEETLAEAARSGTVVQLHEDGDPVVEVDPPENPVFVLSDHHDFTDDEASLLADAADERVRLGPERLHADHAITVAHNYLDTDGFTRY